jgi:hypothetical protein
MFDHKKMWKHLASTHTATSYHVVQNIVLKSLDRANGDVDKATNYALQLLAKAFTPVRRKKCLENGHEPHWAVHEAIWKARTSLDILGAPIAVMTNEERLKVQAILFSVYNLTTLREYYNRRYVYIFVRQDIFPEYQLVQASHVALKAGWMMALDNSMEPIDPSNIYFSVIGVKNQLELALVTDHLKRRDITYSVFQEPDIGDQATAIATYPVLARERGDLLNYKRLKFQ